MRNTQRIIEEAAETVPLGTWALAVRVLNYIQGSVWMEIASKMASSHPLVRDNIETALNRFATASVSGASLKDSIYNHTKLCGFLEGLCVCFPALRNEIEEAVSASSCTINSAALYDAVSAPKTIFAVYRNSDMTEGRGPMKLDRVFLNRKHAASYVDEQPGVMGRREKWSEKDLGDWKIHEIELTDYDVTEKQRADEARRKELLKSLSDEDIRILGLKVS